MMQRIRTVFSEYENACENNDLNLPNLICVITGKGPLKDFYISIVNLKNWKHVKVVTPWLENEDYPTMLGIVSCLHAIAIESPLHYFQGLKYLSLLRQPVQI